MWRVALTQGHFENKKLLGCNIYAIAKFRPSQVQIAGTENTAQYWTNLGSHKLANITGPISAFKSAQCCPSTGTVHWKSKFPMLAPKLGLAMALDWTESRHYFGKLCCMSKSECPAQLWHFTGYKVGITPANRVVCQKDRVRPTNGPSQVRKSSLLW